MGRRDADFRGELMEFPGSYLPAVTLKGMKWKRVMEEAIISLSVTRVYNVSSGAVGVARLTQGRRASIITARHQWITAVKQRIRLEEQRKNLIQSLTERDGVTKRRWNQSREEMERIETVNKMCW